MNITVERVQVEPDVTIGSLSIDGDWRCWTLEDPVREVPGQPVTQWKIKGQTAIPRGTYQVIVDMSPRFKRRLPLLLDVPGYTGVRIHAGNTTDNTEGCLLVGRDRYAKSIGRSQMAMAELMLKLNEAIRRGERVDLTIW